MINLMARSITILIVLSVGLSLQAMELEPRRWTHIPVDTTYTGGGYSRTEGDIVFDPVLRVEDATVEMDTFVFKYIRSFEIANKSASFSFVQAHQNGTWSGLLDGVPTSTQRVGLTDPILRLAINLKGAPPLRGKEYLTYRAKQDIETIVGAGLSIQLPTGDYLDDKLINLGSNRYNIRTRMGVVHKRGKWSMEMTGAVWFYTENDDFYNGNKLEQDPWFTLQGHLIHSFRPGVWVGLSLGYGYGAEATVNGEEKDDRKRDVVCALGYGFKLSPRVAAKIAYLGTRTKASTGLDSDSIVIALSKIW
jgi:hypothetical protein